MATLGVMHGGNADDTPDLLGGHTGGTKFWKLMKMVLLDLFVWVGCGAAKQQPPCQSENLGILVSKAQNSDSRSCGCPVTVLCGSPLQEVT